MTEIEYLCGLILLIAGINLGFHEARKGLQLSDFKKIHQTLLKRIKKQTT